MSDTYPFMEESDSSKLFDGTYFGWFTEVELNSIIHNEVMQGHLKRYGNYENLESDVIEHTNNNLYLYSEWTNKTFKALERNPSERVAKNQYLNISKLNYFEKCKKNVLEYIRYHIEEILDLNYTDAYNYFNELYHNLENSGEVRIYKTFKWLDGDMDKIYKNLIEESILSKKTTFNDFKIAFSGIDLAKVKPLVWGDTKQTTKAYLFLKLGQIGCINFDKTYAHIKIIERLCKIRYASTIFNRFKDGTYPRETDIINSIFKDI